MNCEKVSPLLRKEGPGVVNYTLFKAMLKICFNAFFNHP